VTSGHAPALYDPDWLSLLDARERLKAKGVVQVEAETAICLVVRDRKLKVRFVIEKVIYAPTGGTLETWRVRKLGFEEGMTLRVAVPFDLTRKDINWKASRPKAPWPYGQWQHQLMAHVARIDVSRTDLEREFPMLKVPGATEDRRATDKPPVEALGDAGEEALPPKAEAAAEEAREESVGPADGRAPKVIRASSKEYRAKVAADARWPGGVPPEVSDKEARREICKDIRMKEDEISIETVRRAIGRRKNGASK
jgi:hypothetical protein